MAILDLGFPEPQQQRMLARHDGLEGAVARFERWMEAPGSPVRAVRRLPPREAEFPWGMSVQPRIRSKQRWHRHQSIRRVSIIS